jgi:glycine oxidase
MNSDVIIIGGGVIGLAIARELAAGGARRVEIFDKGACGAESSFAAAGMLAPQAEADRADDFFRLCQRANEMYDSFAADLRDETGIDVELDNAGTLYPAFSAADSAEINRRFAWQTAAGLEVEKLSAAETRKLEPFISPDVRESLLFPRDRQVENRKLVHALRRSAELRGVVIHEHHPVAELVVENGRATGVRIGANRISAGHFVLAAGAWSAELARTKELPEVFPVRGQMIAFQPARRVFDHVIFGPRGYLVPRSDGRLLVGATVERAGFDNRTTSDGIEALRTTAFELAPSLANLRIAEQWSGLRPATDDRQPIIGALPGVERAYIATAHYRNGILLAPLTAKLIAAQIAGENVAAA